MRGIRLASLCIALAAMIFADAAATASRAQETGYAVKKPVFAGACIKCPWGAIGDIVQKAMIGTGWDVQVCHTCAGGPNEVRFVADAKLPPPPRPQSAADIADGVPPPAPDPHGPADFGAARSNLMPWAWEGTHDYKGEKPRKNLRAIATLISPAYLVVAVRKDSGITDLSQLKGRPVKVLWDGVLYKNGPSDEVLAYYGLSPQAIEAAGGKMLNGQKPEERKDFDVVIYTADLSGSPEQGALYEVTQTHALAYLRLPDDLLDRLAKDFDMERHPMPAGYFKGVERPIPTVAWLGHVIYGRDDMPDAFAYALAKALDQHQDLLPWAFQHYDYNIHAVWKTGEVPLHPGAARYYREAGYMK